jgi:hypothetical protein
LENGIFNQSNWLKIPFSNSDNITGTSILATAGAVTIVVLFFFVVVHASSDPKQKGNVASHQEI